MVASLFNNYSEDETLGRKVKRLLREAAVEITLGAVLVGAIAGPLVYRNRAARAGEIPTAFSEIEQITKDFAAHGKPVPPLTQFYADNNEIAMKVFESNNIALKLNKSHKAFATELQTRVDSALAVHPLLTTYAEKLPQDAASALQAVNKLSQAEQELPAVEQALSDSWTVIRIPHFHNVKVTHCSKKGGCSTTNVPVYDYTTHYFTYHEQQGALAAKLLSAFLQRHPDMTIDETLALASQTHAQNQQAIETSMKRELKGQAPTPQQFLDFANTWAKGSNLAKYLPGIQQDENGLLRLSPDWNKASQSAHSVVHVDVNPLWPGPSSYQVSNGALGDAQSMDKASHHITEGIALAGQEAPQLEAKIKDYIGVVLDGQPGNADQLRKDIMQEARDIYQKNYEGGFDVQPFKWLDVVLLTMLFMTLGGAAGFGANRLLKWKDERDEEQGFVQPKPARGPDLFDAGNDDRGGSFNQPARSALPAHGAPTRRRPHRATPVVSDDTPQDEPAAAGGKKKLAVLEDLQARPALSHGAGSAPANDGGTLTKSDWFKQYKP